MVEKPVDSGWRRWCAPFLPWREGTGRCGPGWNRWWALDENLRQLLNAPVYNVDVGLCNGKPFLLWAGLGFDAMILQQLETRLRVDKYLSVPQSAALGLWNATFWHGVDSRCDPLSGDEG